MTRRTRRLVAGFVLTPVSLAAIFAGVLVVEVERARITARPDYGPVLNLNASVAGTPAGGTAPGGTAPGGTAPGAAGGSAVGASRPIVVWLGDSTASGVGVHTAADALPRQVASLSGLGQQVVSLAVSGARVGDVLHHQLPLVPPLAAVVVIDIGANDVAHGARVATFRRQYLAVLRGLPAHALVVLVGIPDMGSPPRLDQPLRAIVGWRGRQFDRAVRSIARTHHVAYVDLAAATGPAFRHHPKQYFFADNYHPNAAGYRLWAEAIIPVFDPVLAAVGGR